MSRPNKPKVLAIVGPTASGKTPLSLLLAEKLRAEIISADSRQVYRQLDIGTAKPSPEDRSRIPHHFIDIIDVRDEYNVATFAADAKATIGELLIKKKTPLVVGGSGLYVKGIVDGFFEGPGKDEALRTKLEGDLRDFGLRKLALRLKQIDPESFATMETGKPRRVIRAIEVFEQTGKSISFWKKQQEKFSTFDVVQVALDWDRSELYRLINHRTLSMILRGLIEEAETLKRNGYPRSLNALNTVGYKEAFDFLEGKTSRNRMVELIQQHTRQYAKRQLTWFRADQRICWYRLEKYSDIGKIADAVLRDHPLIREN